MKPSQPQPEFSVVVPLYNKEQDILKTIGSVQRQRFQSFELIVVDDGSTDNGPSLVSALADERIRLVRQANQGVSAARNAGVREARAGHVAFLDADDLWDEDYLETLARMIRLFPGMGAYATAYRVRTAEGRTRHIRLVGVAENRLEGPMENYFLSASQGEQPLHTSSTCVPKAVLEGLGGFRQGVALGEDLDLWARIALKHPIAYHREAKSTYVLDAANRAMLRSSWATDWVFAETAREAIAGGAVQPGMLPHLLEHLAKVRLEIIRLTLCCEDRSLARQLLARVATRFFWKRKLAYRLLLLMPPCAARCLFQAFHLAAGSSRKRRAGSC